jgi:hypothetical protein
MRRCIKRTKVTGDVKPKGFQDIKGYEGMYALNKKGDLYVYGYIKKCEDHHTQNGYARVVLTKNKKPVVKMLHRVMAETFLENPNNYRDVHHLDENKLNNDIDNIEWIDHKEHGKHSMRNVHNQNSAKLRNALAKKTRKLSWKQVNEIRKLYETGLYSQYYLAGLYNMNTGALSNLLKYKTYRQEVFK